MKNYQASQDLLKDRVVLVTGESKDSLPPAETLMPLYLYLVGPDSHGTSGRIIEANPG